MSETAPKPAGGSASSHRGAIISGAVTVVVLAAVIIGVAALGPSEKTPPPKIGLEQTAPNSESVQLTAQGEQALESGDAAAAVTLANQALQADPTNQAARTLLTKATAAQRSGSNGSGGSSSSDNSNTNGANSNVDKGYTSKVSDMGKLLPVAFKDFFLGDKVVTEAEAQVSATPVSGKQAAMNVTWTVHEADSKSDAQRYVTVVSKKSFPKDGSSVSVDGAPGYFGTDGTRYATCVYVRGRYAFEVLVTGNERDPRGLRTLAEEAAKAFKD